MPPLECTLYIRAGQKPSKMDTKPHNLQLIAKGNAILFNKIKDIPKF